MINTLLKMREDFYLGCHQVLIDKPHGDGGKGLPKSTI